MYEDLGKVISDGFGVWKKNLNLALPFILYVVVIAMAVVALAGLVVGLGLIPPEIAQLKTPEELVSWMQSYLGGILGALMVFMVLLSLAGSYFTAGAISMAVQTMKEGRSTLAAMWSGGRKNFLPMFIIIIISILITLAGFVFFLPAALSWPPSMSSETAAQNHTFVGMIVAGSVLFAIYALVITLILAAAPYALVVDGRGVVEAIKTSISFFNNNKFDVMVLWLVVEAISIGLGMLGSSASFTVAQNVQVQPLSLITELISLLVLAPISIMWWTRLYMVRTSRLQEVESWSPAA
jgi:hypothetical protein